MRQHRIRWLACWRVFQINFLYNFFIGINDNLGGKLVPLWIPSNSVNITFSYTAPNNGNLTLERAIPDEIWNRDCLFLITTTAGIESRSRHTQIVYHNPTLNETAENTWMTRDAGGQGFYFYTGYHCITSATTVNYTFYGLWASGNEGNNLLGWNPPNFSTQCWIQFAIVFK